MDAVNALQQILFKMVKTKVIKDRPGDCFVKTIRENCDKQLWAENLKMSFNKVSHTEDQ